MRQALAQDKEWIEKYFSKILPMLTSQVCENQWYTYMYVVNRKRNSLTANLDNKPPHPSCSNCVYKYSLEIQVWLLFGV